MENEIYFKEVEMKRQKEKNGYYHEGIILVNEAEIKFSVITNQNFYAEEGRLEFLIDPNYNSSRFTFRELNVKIEDLENKDELENRISSLIEQYYEEQKLQ